MEPVVVSFIPNDNPPESQRIVENFPLARVLIDARRLFRPLVFIEFSSQIFFNVVPEVTQMLPQAASLFRIRLTFILTRKCDNGPEETIKTWEYAKEVTLEDALENVINERTLSVPFSVVHCESLTRCDCDCCEYAVLVTATSTSEPLFEQIADQEFELFTTSDFINVFSANVTNTSMSGFAQVECDGCCSSGPC
ncbi:MAG: DUF4489 domain-containing protein [Proteobacteria bacterium]|nr:DUF4489 domain-containing protein [Pseudomonadota bacterium]